MPWLHLHASEIDPLTRPAVWPETHLTSSSRAQTLIASKCWCACVHRRRAPTRSASANVRGPVELAGQCSPHSSGESDSKDSISERDRCVGGLLRRSLHRGRGNGAQIIWSPPRGAA